MPRYFFHLRVDGELFKDVYGLELSNSDMAREECVSAVRQLIDEDDEDGLAPPEFEFYVVDEVGRIVAVLPFES